MHYMSTLANMHTHTNTIYMLKVQYLSIESDI